MGRNNKYNAKKATVDGHTFDSKREAEELKEIQKKYDELRNRGIRK